MDVDGVPLSPAEAEFANALRLLFAKVDAAAPERGVRTLIRRARRAVAAGRPEADVIAEALAGAEARTRRRLELAARAACQFKR